MRLLFLSNVFPSPLHPTKGVFNLNLVRALADVGNEVAVVAPIAWTDWVRAQRARRRQVDNCAEWTGIPVRYPVYFYTPGVLRTAYGWLMWSGIRAAVHDVIGQGHPQAIIAYWALPD